MGETHVRDVAPVAAVNMAGRLGTRRGTGAGVKRGRSRKLHFYVTAFVAWDTL